MANAFVTTARKIYNPLGFKKGYNFVLWFITCGALLGFGLSRLMYLDYWHQFCPDDGDTKLGECFYQGRGGSDTIFMILHLASCLPVAIMVVLQFIPVVRHRWLLVHRLNGYFVLVLYFPTAITGILLGPHSFGGDLSTRSGVVALGVYTMVCMLLALINIKRLQIEQHRAWMIRGWSAAACIITIRIIQIIIARIINSMGSLYQVRPCAQIDYMIGPNRTQRLFPTCADWYAGADPNAHVAVRAVIPGQSPVNIAATIAIGFGPASWIAFTLHVLLAELYLRLTPAEHERLRNVSFIRQREAGHRHPGSSGLTADRIGDAPEWESKQPEQPEVVVSVSEQPPRVGGAP